MLKSYVAENMINGRGEESSAIKGAKMVVNLAAILQNPNTDEAYWVGNMEAVRR